MKSLHDIHIKTACLSETGCIQLQPEVCGKLSL